MTHYPPRNVESQAFGGRAHPHPADWPADRALPHSSRRKLEIVRLSKLHRYKAETRYKSPIRHRNRLLVDTLPVHQLGCMSERDQALTQIHDRKMILIAHRFTNKMLGAAINCGDGTRGARRRRG